MVTEMMAEDEALLERKRAELGPIRSRYESLFHELYPDKTCPSYATTLPVLAALRRYVDEYKTLKGEHGKLVEREPDIRREERQLCNELNERSLQIDNESFQSKPLVTQMSLLSEHIGRLRDERVRSSGTRLVVAHRTLFRRIDGSAIYRILFEHYTNTKKSTDGNGRQLQVSSVDCCRWVHWKSNNSH
jgi:hypothetical protein